MVDFEHPGVNPMARHPANASTFKPWGPVLFRSVGELFWEMEDGADPPTPSEALFSDLSSIFPVKLEGVEIDGALTCLLRVKNGDAYVDQVFARIWIRGKSETDVESPVPEASLDRFVETIRGQVGLG